MRKIKIGNKFVGPDEPCLIVAEAGANHDGILERGKELVRGAMEAGADAIKFQHYVAGKLVTKTAPKYWKDGKPEETQYEVFNKLDKLTKDDWRELFNYAKELGIIIFSTPFDEENVDFLEELDVPAYKVAAADITHLPLIRHISEKGKPVILSVGMATIDEIRESVKTIRSAGNEEIILLHSTTSYPTEPQYADLRMIRTLQSMFPDLPIGFSDHTLGPVIPAAAVAIGAKLVEKHFTIDKSLPGSPDHRLSVDVEEMRQMVDNIRTIEKALGSEFRNGPVEAENESVKYARRSIVANVSIPKGTKITRSMLIVKRPGTGISPKFMDMIVGKVAHRNIDEDQVLTWKDLDFISKAKQLALEASELGKKSNRVSAFTIGVTKNVNNKSLFFPPLRYSPKAICANAIVFSDEEASEIARAVDGIVDVILVDAEEKSKRLKSLIDTVTSATRISRILTFKGNDLTADAADALIAQLVPNIKNKKVSIIGAGNLGTKIALKMMERGANVVITRTNEEVINKVADGLNLIKPKECDSFAVGMIDNLEACKGAYVIIACAQGLPIITSDMVNSMNSEGIIIDAGIGTVSQKAIETAKEKEIRILRLDMRTGFAGAMTTIFETENFVKNVMGSRELNGIRIVAGGIVGRKGDIVVDNISNPAKVLGIADGIGGLLKSGIPQDFLKMLEKVKQKIVK